MADEMLLEETEPATSETQEPEEVDYKAMYESEKANAEKWKAMSRKNEEAYKKAAAENAAQNDPRIQELEERAAKAEKEAEDLRQKTNRAEMVADIATRHEVDQRAVNVLAGTTHEEIEAALEVILSVFGTGPVIKDSGAPKEPPKSNKAVFDEFMNATFN